MKQDTMVLYAGLGAGHLAPMVELAKLVQRHGLAVTIVVVLEPPAKSMDTAAAGAASSSINFHVLQTSADDGEQLSSHPFARTFDLLRRMNAPLRDYLRSVLPSVRALVLDFFCVDALDVAAELGVPACFFFTSSASCLAVYLNLPHMLAAGDVAGDAPLRFPGNRPLKLSDLPKGALDRDDEAHKMFALLSRRIPESRGVLLNTFEWMEPRALRALRDGSCVPTPMPPVYCVGPMVGRGGKKHECLAWLDAQPDSSVVFLCFGSRLAFPKRQLGEIAAGLERSGQRFLWVVAGPRGHGPLAEPDLAALLPEGFLDRTAGRGMVAKSWAPQADVLQHRATGAFVTHCGWNSTLEGLVAGLPLICWPRYAEQGQNKVFVVDEMGAGVAVAGYDGEVVAAAEVEAKVRWVMESPGGRALRERAAEAKAMAAEALKDGGASDLAFAQFLADL